MRANAQSPPFLDREDNCLNIGFEEGDFSQWNLFSGKVTHTGPNPGGFSFINIMQLSPPPGATSTVQHLICNQGFDPVVPTIPRVWPEGGNYSIRLGDGNVNGSNAASIRRTFYVSAQNPSLLYAYAVFLQDPDHLAPRVPYFLIRMTDQNGNNIPAADYAVVANIVSDPSFMVTQYWGEDLYYKNWTSVFVPLEHYIGQQVTLEFRTGDCTESGHFGYAYVDATCYRPEIGVSSPACDSNYILLTAPDGAASYSWTGPGVNGLTTQSVSATLSGTYSVTLTPVTGTAYAMTLDTTLVIDNLTLPPTAGFSSNSPVCIGTPVEFSDTSSGNGTAILSWEWDFGDTQTSTAQHPTHGYTTSGTYEASLVVTNLAGCSDTARVMIEVARMPEAVISPAGPFCVSDDAVALSAIEANGIWAADCGTCIDPASGIFNPAAAGTGTHRITYSFSGICTHSDTVFIEVLADINATITAAGPFCTNDAPYTLQAATQGGTWSGNGVNPGTGVFDPSAAGTGTHTITYTQTGLCGDSDTLLLTVNPVHDPTIYPATPLCITWGDTLLQAAEPGGTWSASCLHCIDPVSGNFNTLAAGAGLHTITYSFDGACPTQQSVTLTVDPPDDVNILPPTFPLCENGIPLQLEAYPTGGVWNASCGSCLSPEGLLDPSVAGTGTHTIVYTSAGTCNTVDSVQLTVHPIPVATFTPDIVSGCSPLTVTYTATTETGVSACHWDFGDGNTGSGCISVSHTYTEQRCMSVSLTLTSAAGCTYTYLQPDLVCVLPTPVAEFSSFPSPPSLISPEISFSNFSAQASSYSWSIDGAFFSTDMNPSFEFPVPQSPQLEYQVCLTAFNDNGCKDSTCQTIRFDSEILLYVPNAFTPDGNGQNDVFFPVISGVEPYSYTLLIFNRWGELIFETGDPLSGWDGTFRGEQAPVDVYVWVIEAMPRGIYDVKTWRGHVSLIR